MLLGLHHHCGDLVPLCYREGYGGSRSEPTRDQGGKTEGPFPALPLFPHLGCLLGPEKALTLEANTAQMCVKIITTFRTKPPLTDSASLELGERTHSSIRLSSHTTHTLSMSLYLGHITVERTCGSKARSSHAGWSFSDLSFRAHRQGRAPRSPGRSSFQLE